MRTHVACSGHLPVPFPTTTACSPPDWLWPRRYPIRGCFTCVGPSQMARPNSYRGCFRGVGSAILSGYMRVRATPFRSSDVMIMQALHCPNCQGTNIIRHGTTRQGKQRYRCQEAVCNGGTFLVDDTYPGHSVGVKQQIVDMAMNASGIRDTARVLHISPSTVIKALKKTRVAKLAGGSLLQASRDTMLDRDGSADAACAADDGSQDAGAAPARSAAGRGQAPPP